MKTSEVLKAAQEKISVPERWTQGSFGRTIDRLPVRSLDPNACAWCAVGSINAVRGNYGNVEAHTVLSQASYGLNLQTADEFNDTHTHPEVLALFDKAIELALLQETA